MKPLSLGSELAALYLTFSVKWSFGAAEAEKNVTDHNSFGTDKLLLSFSVRSNSKINLSSTNHLILKKCSLSHMI
jgi:hypothetical protein